LGLRFFLVLFLADLGLFDFDDAVVFVQHRYRIFVQAGFFNNGRKLIDDGPGQLQTRRGVCRNPFLGPEVPCASSTTFDQTAVYP
jgi:hypothetical protein